MTPSVIASCVHLCPDVYTVVHTQCEVLPRCCTGRGAPLAELRDRKLAITCVKDRHLALSKRRGACHPPEAVGMYTHHASGSLLNLVHYGLS